jgi:hypothetical protein
LTLILWTRIIISNFCSVWRIICNILVSSIILSRAITCNILRASRVVLSLIWWIRCLILLFIWCWVVCHVLSGWRIVLFLRWIWGAAWIFHTLLFRWTTFLVCRLIAGWGFIRDRGFCLVSYRLFRISWWRTVCRFIISLLSRIILWLSRITIRNSLL